MAVVHKGKVAIHCFGQREVEAKKPVDGDTVFAAGSTTKAFTAMLCSTLAIDGRIDLDAPLQRYLPKQRFADDYVSQHATTLDLLTHRTGLPRHDFAWYGNSRSRSQLLAALPHLAPTKAFRSTWQYCNLTYTLAGHLAARVGGASTWEAMMRKELLAPLGMKRSSLSVVAMHSATNYARPYKLVASKARRVPFLRLDAMGPAGSLNTSAKDMARWVQLLLQRGQLDGKTLLPAAAIDACMKPRIVTGQARLFAEIGELMYGLGWMVQHYRGKRYVHHAGNVDGFSAQVALWPDDQLGVVCLANLEETPFAIGLALMAADEVLGLEALPWAQRMRGRLLQTTKARQLLKPRLAAVAGTKPSKALDEYCGEYEHRGYGILPITLTEGSLRLRIAGRLRKLEHFHYDVFKIREGQLDGQLVEFSLEPKDGAVASLRVRLEAELPALRFAKRPEARLRDPKFLVQFAGSYRLVHQDIRVTLRDKTLSVTLPDKPRLELVPRRGLRFNINGRPGFAVVFEMDKSGQVKALVFDQPNGRFRARRKK